MAEYHFHLKVIQRSVGHPGAVFQAAYHARDKLRDERAGKTWDFSRKKDLVHREILAPEGAPAWAFDRQDLWNAAELMERQRNGQPARYADVALPAELSRAAQLALVRDFLRAEFVSRGMIADFAIHEGEGINPHFHLLVTMRELDGREFAETKQRAWNDRKLCYHWREAWALFANRALAREGHDARIDHRSYADRDINLAPQPKLYRNPRDVDRDRRDHVHERRDTARQTQQENGQRVLRDPTIPLRVLTSRRSTFAEHELQRVVRRLTAADQYDDVLAAVMRSPELVRLPKPDEKGRTLFSTRIIVARERSILRTADLLAKRRGHVVRAGYVQQAIASSDRDLSEEQIAALHHLARGTGDLALVQGFAGSGKTTMLRAARTAWEGQGLTVVGAALMGRAAEQLEQDAGIPSQTLKSLELSWEHGVSKLSRRHVLVLDEAALVGTAQFEKLITQVREAGAKLVLVGDVGQLQPIEIGAPMRLLQKRYPVARLQTIHRQRAHAWQREATLCFATDQAAKGLDLYLREGRVRAHATANEAHHAMIASWARDRVVAPLDGSLMLAFRRDDVRCLNELAREVRCRRGELRGDHRVCTERGVRHFAVGERLIFLRNDKHLGVKNGSLGTLEDIEHGKLLVRLDATQHRIVVDPKTYDAIDHGYAATIHKSQGATVDRVYVFASRYMEAAATYVAMSRHRTDVELHYSLEEFRDAASLQRALSRVRIHRMAHDVLEPLAPTPEGQVTPAKVADALLRARPADLDAELKLLRTVAARRMVSMLEVVEELAPIRELRIAEREARHALSTAIRAKDQFELAHPRKTNRRDAAYLAREAALKAAERNDIDARLRLERARRDPDLVRDARRLASQHNRRVQRAQDRVVELLAARREAGKHDVVFGLVLAENVKARAIKLRPSEAHDHGQAFEIVRERAEGAARFVELRAATGGPHLLVHAEDCTRRPDGLAQLGPALPNRARTPQHDRGHGR